MTYNFKREASLHIVVGSKRYRLNILPDVSFSQTFDETAVPVKTLHSQSDMFENAVITKANPANFNFTIPVTNDVDFKAVLDLLLNYNTSTGEVLLGTFDLYVELNSVVYRISNAVLENGVFTIAKGQILYINCSGTASRLSQHLSPIPGSLQPTYASIPFAAPNSVEVRLGGVVQSRITSFSLEVTNNVSWVDYATIHKSIGVTSASDTMYPEVFVVGSRTISGSFSQYVTDENKIHANSWAVGSSLEFRAGNLGGKWLLFANLPQTVYTNRLGLDELLMQSYDFRMISNPSSFENILGITTTTTPLTNTALWAAI